jgi:hypothetical protein
MYLLAMQAPSGGALTYVAYTGLHCARARQLWDKPIVCWCVGTAKLHPIISTCTGTIHACCIGHSKIVRILRLGQLLS